MLDKSELDRRLNPGPPRAPLVPRPSKGVSGDHVVEAPLRFSEATSHCTQKLRGSVAINTTCPVGATAMRKSFVAILALGLCALFSLAVNSFARTASAPDSDKARWIGRWSAEASAPLNEKHPNSSDTGTAKGDCTVTIANDSDFGLKIDVDFKLFASSTTTYDSGKTRKTQCDLHGHLPGFVTEININSARRTRPSNRMTFVR